MLIFPMACLLLGGGAAIFAFGGMGGEWEGVAKAIFFLANIVALAALGFDLGRQSKTGPGHGSDELAGRLGMRERRGTNSLRR